MDARSAVVAVVNRERMPAGTAESIMASIQYYYDKCPWTYVPGPWAIQITAFKGDTVYSDRVAAILGCSDKNQRGLAIYRSFDDYMARPPLPKAVALMFSDGKKSRPVLHKTNGLSMEALRRDDVGFLEFGLKCVADFITEAAKLGGGGPTPSARTMTPEQVVKHLSYGNAHYPCLQTASTSDGDVQIRMGLHVTGTTIIHTQTGGSVPVSDVNPLPFNLKICIICHKTESDCRSVSDRGLLRCSACNSQTERYCSRECQKADWKRHKLTCTAAAAAWSS